MSAMKTAPLAISTPLVGMPCSRPGLGSWPRSLARASRGGAQGTDGISRQALRALTGPSRQEDGDSRHESKPFLLPAAAALIMAAALPFGGDAVAAQQGEAFDRVGIEMPAPKPAKKVASTSAPKVQTPKAQTKPAPTKPKPKAAPVAPKPAPVTTPTKESALSLKGPIRQSTQGVGLQGVEIPNPEAGATGKLKFAPKPPKQGFKLTTSRGNEKGSTLAPVTLPSVSIGNTTQAAIVGIFEVVLVAAASSIVAPSKSN